MQEIVEIREFQERDLDVVLVSVIGNGAAGRAASITWFLWLGLLAWRLLRLADRSITQTSPAV